MATSGTLGLLGGTKSVAAAGALIAPALLTMCMIKSGEGKGLKGTSQSKVA